MDGRIVVGVDGSPGSITALLWAREEAERRDATLEAVICWHAPNYVPGRVWPFAGRTLHDVVSDAGFHRRSPGGGFEAGDGLTLLETTAEGKAGPALCKIATGADLLVVGSHGFGRFSGMLLGSVGQHCVSHAPCPVVIVRDDEEARAA
ncbi:MAG: universal stress protein [Actinobacteria bacterium]|nr:universal stress protein [Actinomycetota bacterium]